MEQDVVSVVVEEEWNENENARAGDLKKSRSNRASNVDIAMFVVSTATIQIRLSICL